MGKSRPLTEYISETEHDLATYKAVLAEFPDARYTNYGEFVSKSVNYKYSKLNFERRYNGLFVIPISEVKFSYGGVEEIVSVHSAPKYSRLVYTMRWRKDPIDGKPIMKFSRLSINLKNNGFKEDMLSICGAEIMKYIGDNPGYHLDTKHLSPRLRKLLTFI